MELEVGRYDLGFPIVRCILREPEFLNRPVPFSQLARYSQDAYLNLTSLSTRETSHLAMHAEKVAHKIIIP